VLDVELVHLAEQQNVMLAVMLVPTTVKIIKATTVKIIKTTTVKIIKNNN
jgi:hypothetical protein